MSSYLACNNLKGGYEYTKLFTCISYKTMMKKTRLLVLAVALLTFILSGCSGKTASQPASDAGKTPETLTVQHELGKAAIPLQPQKIVVLDYGALDTLDSLDNTAKLAVSKSYLPPYLAKYKAEEYTDIGDIKEPNIEKIHAFGPDLIVISGRQAKLYNELSKIAPTLYIETNPARYLEDFEKNTLLLGSIIDKKDKAQTMLTNIKTRIAKTKEQFAASPSRALVIMTNDGSLSAYGKGSRFGIIHDVLGVKTADENIAVSTHGQEIGFEYIAEKNPDILFVIDRTVVVGGTNLASRTLDNGLVQETNAGKNKKIIYLDPALWYLSGGGLQSTAQMVADISQSIN